MIAIQPPEYWPRLAYVGLMATVDTFILADTYQYSRQSFQNRTRLRNPNGWHWISVPLKGGQHGQRIFSVRIRKHLPWIKQHLKGLHYNYQTTPFFNHYFPEIERLYSRPWTHLGDLTCSTVRLINQWVGGKAELIVASDLEQRGLSLESVIASQKLIVPHEAVHAEHFNATHVYSYQHPLYHQNFNGFQPEMTVLDLLFNYGPASADILMRGCRQSLFSV